MKKCFFLVPIFLMFTLSGCIFTYDDGEWKGQFGDPELFINNILGIEGDEEIFLYGKKEDGYRGIDTDCVVAHSILESGPFTKSENKSARVERYFIYQAYWQPATTGPNYCNMAIYDDGFIEIHHKNSIGPHSYLYFTMDKTKANSVVDLAFSIVDQEVL